MFSSLPSGSGISGNILVSVLHISFFSRKKSDAKRLPVSFFHGKLLGKLCSSSICCLVTTMLCVNEKHLTAEYVRSLLGPRVTPISTRLFILCCSLPANSRQRTTLWTTSHIWLVVQRVLEVFWITIDFFLP
jgi:hypothetical protein